MSDPAPTPTTPPHPLEPDPSPVLPDSVSTLIADTGSDDPNADTASGLRIHRDPSLNRPADAPKQDDGDPRRRIEWVRPTDLVARVSARASERGVEWNVRAHERARTQARAAISDARTKATSLSRTISTKLTRTGPDPIEQEVARL